MRKLLRTSPALVILALVLAADVLCVALRSQEMAGPVHSTVGRILAVPLGRYWSCGPDPRHYVWYCLDPDGNIITIDKTHSHPSDVTYLAYFSAVHDEWDAGFFAPILHEQRVRFEQVNFGNLYHAPITPEEFEIFKQDVLKQHVMPQLDTWGMSGDELASSVSPITLSHTRLLPLGIAHDAITLTTLLLLIWSIRLNFARVREARRLRAAQCPNCRYSIVGLPTNTCPECGHEFAQSQTNPT